jgi:hypothetical protein
LILSLVGCCDNGSTGHSGGVSQISSSLEQY